MLEVSYFGCRVIFVQDERCEFTWMIYVKYSKRQWNLRKGGGTWGLGVQGVQVYAHINDPRKIYLSQKTSAFAI